MEAIGRILYEALGLNKLHKIKTVFSIMVAAIENYVKQVCTQLYGLCMSICYESEYNFSQTDDDDPLLFIGNYIINHANGDTHTKEVNDTSKVWDIQLMCICCNCYVYSYKYIVDRVIFNVYNTCQF